LRREGRRKRKAGAKNEKAVLIIALPLYRGQEEISQISKEKSFFVKKTPFLRIEKREKAVFLWKKPKRFTKPPRHYLVYPALRFRF
jgi:hypothetical protein